LLPVFLRATNRFKALQKKLLFFMARRIYISCEPAERELIEVKALLGFLNESSCTVSFAPFTTDFCGYRPLEELIEQADAFIAVIAAVYNDSTWLNHELLYASTLNRFRMTPRPRLFGLRIPPHRLPRCSEQIQLQWLDATNPHLLLQDSPPHDFREARPAAT